FYFSLKKPLPLDDFFKFHVSYQDDSTHKRLEKLVPLFGSVANLARGVKDLSSRYNYSTSA
ncbi:hypothetical protein ACP5PY_28445, partial [Photobacterium leiognathi subsp. mandapamensis]